MWGLFRVVVSVLLLAGVAAAVVEEQREAVREVHPQPGRHVDVVLTAAGSVLPSSALTGEDETGRPTERLEPQRPNDLLDFDLLQHAEVRKVQAHTVAAKLVSVSQEDMRPRRVPPASLFRREVSSTGGSSSIEGLPGGGWGGFHSKRSPKDCKWGEWEKWGSCSTTCGRGFRVRARVIAKPATGNGKKCLPQDAQEREDKCNRDKKCPEKPCTADLCTKGLLPKTGFEKIGCGVGSTTCTAAMCCDKGCDGYTCPTGSKKKTHAKHIRCGLDCNKQTCCDDEGKIMQAEEAVQEDVGLAVEATKNVATKTESVIEDALR